MLAFLSSVKTYQGILARKRYLLREGFIDLFGNSEVFFEFGSRNEKILKKRKHKIFTITLAFSKEDRLTLKGLKDITLFWLKHFFCGYRLEELVFCAVVHTDTEHKHIHISVANFFAPTGSYLYYYNHRTDMIFLNQLNRYIEEKFNLHPAFEKNRYISFPQRLLSKKKKGRLRRQEEELLSFLEGLNEAFEQGLFNDLEEVLSFLREEREGFKFLYYKELRPFPLGEVGFKLAFGPVVKVRGIALHPLFYQKRKKKKRYQQLFQQLFFFDNELFLKLYRNRFRKNYRRRKGSLKKLKRKYLALKNKTYYKLIDELLDRIEKQKTKVSLPENIVVNHKKDNMVPPEAS